MNAVNGSTATGTTATADSRSSRPAPAEVQVPAARPYVGRFAPSPTGALHLGSLVAALGSFLEARCHGGRWLVRIEDLDTPRVRPGCAARILRTLDSFGLGWDGEVTYQSSNTERYEAAAASLRSQGLTFECSCARRLRTGTDKPRAPDICRDTTPRRLPTATRFRIDEREIVLVEDSFQGTCGFELGSMGDVVIRRRDGVFAYQLAVVVDDAWQGITHVVRGADLLASTAWQQCLQRALAYAPPAYAHLPLIVEPDGSKLAKSRRSVPLDVTRVAPLLTTALRLLRQEPPPSFEFEAPRTVLEWAIRHWNPHAFHGIRTLAVPRG